ncbi:MAG: methylmalonyl Co-A mutase-associated GTPase MeaB [Lentisphaeria bacterium]|jgi:LAO/AO transport system kinase|nr:methylmalonyl Co-A mutase-associated GTPase MeaB [Lentisphaeria bacterium]
MSSSANVPVSSLDLLEPAMAGRLPAIARLLTRAESGAEEVYEALSELYRHTGKAHVVGITGVPGSGKSTLLAKLAREIRRSGRRVGIVAVDPTSPFSGGAILGDRIRMNELAADPGVFVRSMATRGIMGGLARNTLDAVDILDATGYDVVLIETVGVGQDEIEVVQAVHTTVVISAPGLGDDIQAVKAGVLEIADIHVVSKCERPDANRAISDLTNMLKMNLTPPEPSAWQIPVVATSAEKGEGLSLLQEKIDEHSSFLKESGTLLERRKRIAEQRLLKEAEELLRDRFLSHPEDHVQDLLSQLLRREIHPHHAARQLIDNC